MSRGAAWPNAVRGEAGAGALVRTVSLMILLPLAHRATPWLAACAALALPCPSFAAESPAIGNGADSIVITAARAPQRLADAIPHTTVLTRADIEASQAVDLPTLLAAESGVQFASNGSRGTASSLFVRGAQNRQVLVLVDGVPLARQDASGQVGIEHLMLDQVERIEIVRGNQSALYGAGAVGGVIQVFTRRASAGAPLLSVMLEGGARGLWHGAAQGAVVVGATEVSLGLSRVRDAGFSALDPADYPSVNPDRDGYGNTSATLNLRHAVADGHALSLNLSRSEGQLDYDSRFATPADLQRSRTVRQSLSLGSENRITSTWSSRLLLSRQRDDARYDETGSFGFSGRYTTVVESLNWTNSVALGDTITVLAGFDRQHQHIAADDGFGGLYDVGRQLWAAFGGVQARLAGHELSLNLRHDDVDGHAAPTSVNLGWGYAWTPQWKAFASAGNGFSLPPLGYLYAPYYGNPGLQAERARNAELGLQWTAWGQRLRATVYNARVSQEIDYDTSSFRFENVARTRNRGLELSWEGRIAGGEWRGSLTSQNPVDASTGAQRLRRSHVLAALSVQQPLGAGWRAGLALRYVGGRPDSGAVMLPAYTVADLTVQKDLGRGLQWFGRVENLGSVRYQTARGYTQAPRGLFTGLRWALGS